MPGLIYKPAVLTSEERAQRSLYRRNLGQIRVNAQKQVHFHDTRSDLVRIAG